MVRGVILGATSGVGRAVVEQRFHTGDELVAVGRRGASFADAQSATSGVRWVSADIRDFDSLARTLHQAAPFDYLVNCVGVGFYAPVGSDNTAAWREILDTNLRGLLNVVSIIGQACPGLADFVHVSSLAAHRVSETPGNLAYSVAKAGARTIVQELRRELRAQGSLTRVSMVSPGLVEGTDFGKNYYNFRDASVSGPGLYDQHVNLAPSDVAGVISYVLALPRHMEVLDVLVAPTAQPR
jgi:3-hydroxy acid dehydrogenase/malonic semialdehyde reductase